MTKCQVHWPQIVIFVLLLFSKFGLVFIGSTREHIHVLCIHMFVLCYCISLSIFSGVPDAGGYVTV